MTLFCSYFTQREFSKHTKCNKFCFSNKICIRRNMFRKSHSHHKMLAFYVHSMERDMMKWWWCHNIFLNETTQTPLQTHFLPVHKQTCMASGNKNSGTDFGRKIKVVLFLLLGEETSCDSRTKVSLSQKWDTPWFMNIVTQASHLYIRMLTLFLSILVKEAEKTMQLWKV